MRTILLIIFLSFGWAFTPIHAQNVVSDMSADSYALYYYRDRTDIQEDYLDNAVQMARIRHILLHSTRIDSITIYSYSSPEGTPRRNNFLARRRAEVAKDFILNNCAEGVLSAENIHLRPMGENWEGLHEELRLHYHHPNRDKVLRIMRANVSTETKKWRLQNLDDGYTYKLIIREHMPALRMATWVCVHNAIMPLALDTVFPEGGVATVPMPHHVAEPLDLVLVEKRPLVSLKTNLLSDALLTPNVSLEFYIGKQYSITGHYSFAWWSRDTKHLYYQLMDGQLEFRRYFKADYSHSGHYLSVYGQGNLYDFSFDAERAWQGEGWGVGLGYGYVWQPWKNKRWKIETFIRVGYYQSLYDAYHASDPYNGKYYYDWNGTIESFIRRNNRLRWFGPTNIGVSFSYDIIHRTLKPKKYTQR
jgi:hypothetical protein